MRLFNVLLNFLFAASETMHDYYLETFYIRFLLSVTKQLKTESVRKLGNTRKDPESHKMIV